MSSGVVPPARSTSVTVVAICFAAYYGFGVLSGFGQIVILTSVMWDEMWADGMAHVIVAIAIGAMVFFAGQLAVSIGLLMRRRWARSAFIILRIVDLVLMVVGVIWMVAASILWRMGVGEIVIVAIIAALNIPLAALLIWIMRRLRTPQVIAEFDPAQ